MKKRKLPIPKAKQPALSAQAAQTLLMTAFALHQQGRLDQAEKIYRQLLAAQPRHLDALQLLARIALQKKEADEALALFTRAIAIKPHDPSLLMNRGNALSMLARHAEALASYDKALGLAPGDPEILYNRGKALRELERYEEALVAYDQALSKKPGDPETLYNRGNALYALKRWAEALADYDQALASKPRHPEALYNRGNALVKLRRFEEATASYDQALSLRPDYPEAWANRGNALCEEKRYNLALASCDEALRLRSVYPEALAGRALALLGLNRPEEALANSEQALAIKPDSADALNVKGTALHRLNRHPESLTCYEQALALEPEGCAILNNLGNLYLALGLHQEASASFAKALAIEPNQPETHWNEAMSRLVTGDFSAGWQKYEWRWQCVLAPRDFPQPLWLGQEDLAGKTILLHPEQGLGDTLQFCRYAPLVAALGARVILEVQAPLKPLFRTMAGVEAVIDDKEERPAFDLQTPLLSLPLAFATTLGTIPCQIPYLTAEPEKIADWAEFLGEKTRPRVGLVWTGNPKHKNDHNRSLAFAELAGILELPCDFVSLHKEFRDEEEKEACEKAGVMVVSDRLSDFAETAALIMNLDLAISVDTSVVHLAGALGKPVWVLLPFSPDFRWLLDRADSPWYPTARLFRQQTIGQWPPVLAEVQAELSSLLL